MDAEEAKDWLRETLTEDEWKALGLSAPLEDPEEPLQDDSRYICTLPMDYDV